MKNLKFLLIAFLSIGFFFACKKKDSTPAPAVVGFWLGKWGKPTASLYDNYAFLFKKNGIVRIYSTFGANIDTTNTGSKVDGSYTVIGNTVNTTYADRVYKYSSTATVDEGFTTMTGTFGVGTATSGEGNFKVTKQ